MSKIFKSFVMYIFCPKVNEINLKVVELLIDNLYNQIFLINDLVKLNTDEKQFKVMLM